ncbi:MAG: Sulfurtransferase complex subunit TusB [Candidatus Thermoplasmatota archaeon]|nr:Sulfurtransferase complex subunit TusB [Candidatus Thermoplasmatota archaeon]
MRTAFVVIRSPQELDPTHMMHRVAHRDEASAILFEDAVYNALQAAPAERMAKAAHDVLVAADDLEARGFSQKDLRVGRAVPYDEIVECIMERTERTVTV